MRPGELRNLRWIEKRKSCITIPGSFLKGANSVDHYVPLAPQVKNLLGRLYVVTKHSEYIFPGVTSSKAMSKGALSTALRRLGYRSDQQTWHGFRTTASTLLNELGYAPDLIEAQLAHKLPGGAVRDAYNRAQYKKQRAEMMKAYADYLDELREKYWMG